MAGKANKIKKRRLSKGLRRHIRRLKQNARKDGTVYKSPVIRSVTRITTASEPLPAGREKIPVAIPDMSSSVKNV